jgi:citrate lyase beta subunit
MSFCHTAKNTKYVRKVECVKAKKVVFCLEDTAVDAEKKRQFQAIWKILVDWLYSPPAEALTAPQNIVQAYESVFHRVSD